MGDAQVAASRWRLVEVGRVVHIREGTHAGHIATIVEIIDHKRILVDGPSEKAEIATPRHAAALSDVALTAIVIPKLPRAAGHTAVKNAWAKHEVDKKWDESSWAKTRERQRKRSGMSDFDRFKAMRLKKQKRFEVRKALAKVKASA